MNVIRLGVIELRGALLDARLTRRTRSNRRRMAVGCAVMTVPLKGGFRPGALRIAPRLPVERVQIGRVRAEVQSPVEGKSAACVAARACAQAARRVRLGAEGGQVVKVAERLRVGGIKEPPVFPGGSFEACRRSGECAYGVVLRITIGK